jgi:hypothetical protein
MEQEQIRMVLNDLKALGMSEFSSHDFIKRFAANAEYEYIEMLWSKRNAEHPSNSFIHKWLLNWRIRRKKRV